MSDHQGVIVAGHEVTAQVAEEILLNGGNAYDAAVTALFVSFNSEPCMSSPGGGGFANIHTKDGHKEILDFFCHTPRFKQRPDVCDFYPFTVNFGGALEDFHIGHGSHAVPGMMAGIFEMHRKYGTIPIDELVQPALNWTKKGIPLDAFQFMDVMLLENMIRTGEEGKEIYFPNDKVLQEGEILFLPDLSDFIYSMTKEGPREFYEGEIAQRISRDSQEKKGHIGLDDFVHYQVNASIPTSIAYRGKTVNTTGMPSLGGLVIAMGLGELGLHSSSVKHHLSKEHQERLSKVLDVMENTVRKPEVLFSQLDSYKNISYNKKWGSTTHFGILDKWGNAVSITVSNGEGSGYIIPSTSCYMNNMLGEAALLPEGFYSWKENTRLNSLMSPTIVVNAKDKAEIVTGTGGAGRIPGAILQVLHYLMDYGLSVDEAVHSPRMHLTPEVLNIEPGLEPGASIEAYQPKIWEDKHMYFGGVHTIRSSSKGVEAVGDRRRYGVKRIL